MLADDNEKIKSKQKHQVRFQKRINRRTGDQNDSSAGHTDDNKHNKDGNDKGMSKIAKRVHSTDNVLFERLRQQQLQQSQLSNLNQHHQHVLVTSHMHNSQVQSGSSFVYPPPESHQQIHTQQQTQQQQQEIDTIQSLDQVYHDRDKIFTEVELEKEKMHSQELGLLGDMDHRKYYDDRLNELKKTVDNQTKMLNTALSLLNKIVLKFDIK